MGKTLSDHNPLELTFHWGRVSTPIPTWKLRPELLEDQVFRAALAETTINYFSENAGTASTCQIEWDAYKTVIRGAAIGVKAGVRMTLVRQISELETQLGRLDQEAARDETKRINIRKLI